MKGPASVLSKEWSSLRKVLRFLLPIIFVWLLAAPGVQRPAVAQQTPTLSIICTSDMENQIDPCG